MKKLIILHTLSAFIVLFSSQSIFAQGPWTQPKGGGYSQVVFNTIPTYSSIFNGTGGSTRQSERLLSEMVISGYLEYGLLDKLTVGGTVPLVSVSSGDASSESVTPTYAAGDLTSLGNVGIFGKYALIDKSLKLSLITQIDFPTSTRDDITGLSTGVNALSFQPKLSAGGGTAKWYYFGYFGYGLRSNDFHDFLHFGAEAGYRVNDKLLLILHAQRLHNVNNGDVSVDSPANIETGLYTSFQEYSAMEFKIFAEDLYKGFGGFLTGGGSFLGSLVSVAASPAISIGIFYKWE